MPTRSRSWPEAANLLPPQADKLRRRLIEQRAARTFSLDDGTFVLHDQITIPVTSRELDVRSVIYLGAHLHLSEQRLAIELRQLGTHFTLDPESSDQLHRFGFGDAERPILQALRAGTSVPELETVRELDPRTARAVIYALAACDVATRVAVPRTPTPPAIDSLPPAVVRTPTSPNVARTPTPPSIARTLTPAESSPAHRPRRRVVSRSDAAIPVRRRATSAPRLEQEPAVARTTSSRAATEPSVGRAPSRPAVARAPSRPQVGRTPTPSVARTITSSDDRALAAEAFERGRSAIRAEQLDQAVVELARACELSPSNVDYQALCGWVRFCIAADKEAIVAETRKVLEQAIRTSETPIVARFYLGRVERMVGREREALRHFNEVLEADPHHAAAATEIRILEARIAANAKR